MSVAVPKSESSWWKPGWIQEWDPEDSGFWESTGKRIAWKNLIVSIPALHLAFAIWLLWSAIVVNLNNVGYNFSIGQLFWLTAIPGLTGPTLRIPHSFLPSKLGGWLTHIIAVGTLLIPTVWMFLAIVSLASLVWMYVVIQRMLRQRTLEVAHHIEDVLELAD